MPYQATIQFEFWHGDIVFLRVNSERCPGMVIGIHLPHDGTLSYDITWEGNETTSHYAIELTRDFVSSEWIEGEAAA